MSAVVDRSQKEKEIVEVYLFMYHSNVHGERGCEMMSFDNVLVQ